MPSPAFPKDNNPLNKVYTPSALLPQFLSPVQHRKKYPDLPKDFLQLLTPRK